jgi:hypothetical protein
VVSVIGETKVTVEATTPRPTWTRTLNSETWNIPPGQRLYSSSASPFQMYRGDTITFRMTYTPSNRSVSFGLVQPNGEIRWAGDPVTTGSINRRTTARGSDGLYRIVIQNNSTTQTVNVQGSYTYVDNRRRLLFLRHPTFQANGASLSQIQNDVFRPFNQQHFISFNPTHRTFSTAAQNASILNKCRDRLNFGTSCTCATIANCSNDRVRANGTPHELHHSNAYKNIMHLSRSRYNISGAGSQFPINTTGFDLFAVVVASPMCRNDGGHRTVWGVADGHGTKWTYSDNSTVFNAHGIGNRMSRIRVLQHEISHNFGAYDFDRASNPCVTGANCIMNHNTWRYIAEARINIWCANCNRDMDNTLHLD